MAENLTFNTLPETREDLGYKWRPVGLPEALNHFAKFLERNKARVFEQDVYASNDRIYRNILIQLPFMSEVFLAEDIHIQFDVDEGRQFILKKE